MGFRNFIKKMAEKHCKKEDKILLDNFYKLLDGKIDNKFNLDGKVVDVNTFIIVGEKGKTKKIKLSEIGK